MYVYVYVYLPSTRMYRYTYYGHRNYGRRIMKRRRKIRTKGLFFFLSRRGRAKYVNYNALNFIQSAERGLFCNPARCRVSSRAHIRFHAATGFKIEFGGIDVFSLVYILSVPRYIYILLCFCFGERFFLFFLIFPERFRPPPTLPSSRPTTRHRHVLVLLESMVFFHVLHYLIV